MIRLYTQVRITTTNISATLTPTGTGWAVMQILTQYLYTEPTKCLNHFNSKGGTMFKPGTRVICVDPTYQMQANGIHKGFIATVSSRRTSQPEITMYIEDRPYSTYTISRWEIATSKLQTTRRHYE